MAALTARSPASTALGLAPFTRQRPSPARIAAPCRICGRPRTWVVRAAAEEEVPDASFDLVARNQALVRGLPLWAGGAGLVGLLANRALSGIAPVVDASSSQSRADVLGIVMSAVLLLTGLQWLALKPKPISAVPMEGQQVTYVDREARLPAAAVQEMQWAWESLSSSARIRSLAVIYQGRNVCHYGMARLGIRLGDAKMGDVCQKAIASGKGNYLANLILYPGRMEFVAYLPENTQGVVVQPIGKQGVVVVGSDTQRGISRLDQAWIAAIADKLEVTLEGYNAPGRAAGFSTSSKGSKAAKV